MNDKLKKVLKIVAVTGIVTAGVFALINSEEIREYLKSTVRKLRKSPDCFDDDKAKLLLIAKQINRDIKNTERRTSEKAHSRNQKKFNNMKWGIGIISRDDIIKN